MASVWLLKRHTKQGQPRYRVEYRAGGREAPMRYGGSFKTKREALERKAWIAGELANRRIPDIRHHGVEASVETLATVAERWRQSRISVAEGTRRTHIVNVGRITPVLGTKVPTEITKADVAALVAKLHDDGLARESIRKTIATLAMVLDHAEVAPNPARRVELPERKHEDVNPPTATYLEAILAALPHAYRLPTLVLEATGLRVGELEALTWGDVDEHDGRLLIAAARTKTRRPRWVDVPEVLFEALVDLTPREDRDLGGQVFAGFGADRFRTALTRACKATGTPHFHPHDLRHRRATLWHLSGVPAAQAAGWLGHSAQEHLRTYAHVMLDRTELGYTNVLTNARVVPTWVPTSASENGD